MPHVAMPRPPLSHSRTSSVCVASISTGSSAWRRGTRHSGPPHPLTGVVGGPEAWSNAVAPQHLPGPSPLHSACPEVKPERPELLPANGAHCLHPSFTEEDDIPQPKYSCLENPMDGGAHRLQSMGSLRVGHDFTFTFTFLFHALEKEMATHSSILAQRIPGTAEPGGLPSMGSHRVGHD